MDIEKHLIIGGQFGNQKNFQKICGLYAENSEHQRRGVRYSGADC